MEIYIEVRENGFTVETKRENSTKSLMYVAETERSLLDLISKIWREYKNDNPIRGKHIKGD